MDKLRVFISWSGERAHSVAKVIKTWVPDVVRNAETWLSSEDLQKGLQWLPELNKNLSTTGFGLIVLTAENKNAPWLLFEAGVISKALPDKHCCPLLCDLKQTDVSGPLAQFQGTTLTVKDDMLKLVKTMNDACGASKVEDDRLTKWFDMAWEEFSKKTGDIITAKTNAPSAVAKAGPTDRELLEDILRTVRSLVIDQRPSMERWMARGFDGPINVPPDVLLHKFSKLDPEMQKRVFDMITRGREEVDAVELNRELNRMFQKLSQFRWPERDKPPDEPKKQTK